MMVESVGKKLSKARLKRGLSIDEAAHATKLRPDKIVALENDDFSLFASNIYAKGFLQIYGRFLQVDVADFASTLAASNPISIEDYQYLSSGAPPRREERVAHMASPAARGPSLLSVFIFIALLGVVGFGLHIYVNWQRIAPEAAARKDSPAPAAAPPATVATTAGSPGAAAKSAPARPPAAPALRADVMPPLAMSDREFVASQAATTATVPGGAANEVLVEPLKKTWIKVRKDDPNSPPIFEDYLYPDSPPLKLKGTRFFIEARDPRAIQIRKNGAPMAYQEHGVDVR